MKTNTLAWNHKWFVTQVSGENVRAREQFFQTFFSKDSSPIFFSSQVYLKMWTIEKYAEWTLESIQIIDIHLKKSIIRMFTLSTLRMFQYWKINKKNAVLQKSDLLNKLRYYKKYPIISSKITMSKDFLLVFFTTIMSSLSRLWLRTPSAQLELRLPSWSVSTIVQSALGSCKDSTQCNPFTNNRYF